MKKSKGLGRGPCFLSLIEGKRLFNTSSVSTCSVSLTSNTCTHAHTYIITHTRTHYIHTHTHNVLSQFKQFNYCAAFHVDFSAYDFNITNGSANDNLTSANLYGGEERHKWT